MPKRFSFKWKSSSAVLLGLFFLSSVGLVMVGGFEVLPRFLISLGVAVLVMVLVLQAKWDWLMGFAGIIAFIVVARFLPQSIVPYAPMSLVDMIQSPLSLNSVLLGTLVLIGFIATMAYLWASQKR